MRTKSRLSEEKEKKVRVSRTRAAIETPREEEPAQPAPKTRSPKKARKTPAAAVEAAEAPVKKRSTRVKVEKPKKIEVPSILLEGDRPSVSSASGPGRKFELGSAPVSQKFEGAETDLPEAYGTKKLFLTARDPHWLYANWDLTMDQQSRLNSRSAEGHLILRLYGNKIEGHPLYEVHVHPESRHWFAHVERAGQPYAAELGYYSPVGRWTRVAASSSTITPPDSVSEDSNAEFATIPFEFPFSKLLDIVKAAVRENRPLAQAIEDLRRAGHPALPRINGLPADWTQDQENALAKVIAIDDSRRVWMGSLEITELIRRRLAQEMSSFGIMSSLGVSSMGISSFSSPLGGLPSKGFWFMVNAELIIYGATEPDAKVTLGGNPVKLRPDGSFSFRFALPDGNYDLPAVAVSADGTDARAADLKFSRQTEYLGEVGVHPQDPTLKAPLPDNI
jgi:uncharacterized protein